MRLTRGGATVECPQARPSPEYRLATARGRRLDPYGAQAAAAGGAARAAVVAFTPAGHPARLGRRRGSGTVGTGPGRTADRGGAAAGAAAQDGAADRGRVPKARAGGDQPLHPAHLPGRGHPVHQVRPRAQAARTSGDHPRQRPVVHLVRQRRPVPAGPRRALRPPAGLDPRQPRVHELPGARSEEALVRLTSGPGRHPADGTGRHPADGTGRCRTRPAAPCSQHPRRPRHARPAPELPGTGA
ncbi:hypothetical protein EDD39_7471 [Kitasatospora cineracea]|uniref:Uncharacterized protein n=1 Tax=Kitasatospora cineracea TaxID=88074 RepID=A0A8G1UAE2_9ACTN|nr:hypothetical protein EDD39_7471 [Kitasatospora cineracea]